MHILKATSLTLATASILAISTAAQANSTNATNTTNAFLANTSDKHADVQFLRLFDVSAVPLRGDRFLGSSRTATLYYKKGVKSFEKGSLDKADRHFRAALRADGSKGLNKAAYHYLANISHKQGDTAASKRYATAYYNLK